MSDLRELLERTSLSEADRNLPDDTVYYKWMKEATEQIADLTARLARAEARIRSTEDKTIGLNQLG